ncbi:hypothetical protein GDO78_001227 [Eleutherodactylus coqui]|uniref:Uncharacterized protein n=1 Tax=Eleutherodactylus coqui TaxID=57060 RepID=A0A8J6FV14_ELECQ|nr:hypothetical protein GDO78_001227 [Eleutherodactylus coqui]
MNSFGCTLTEIRVSRFLSIVQIGESLHLICGYATFRKIPLSVGCNVQIFLEGTSFVNFGSKSYHSGFWPAEPVGREDPCPYLPF